MDDGDTYERTVKLDLRGQADLLENIRAATICRIEGWSTQRQEPDALLGAAPW